LDLFEESGSGAMEDDEEEEEMEIRYGKTSARSDKGLSGKYTSPSKAYASPSRQQKVQYGSNSKQSQYASPTKTHSAEQGAHNKRVPRHLRVLTENGAAAKGGEDDVEAEEEVLSARGKDLFFAATSPSPAKQKRQQRAARNNEGGGSSSSSPARGAATKGKAIAKPQARAAASGKREQRVKEPAQPKAKDGGAKDAEKRVKDAKDAEKKKNSLKSLKQEHAQALAMLEELGLGIGSTRKDAPRAAAESSPSKIPSVGDNDGSLSSRSNISSSSSSSSRSRRSKAGPPLVPSRLAMGGGDIAEEAAPVDARSRLKQLQEEMQTEKEATKGQEKESLQDEEDEEEEEEAYIPTSSRSAGAASTGASGAGADEGAGESDDVYAMRMNRWKGQQQHEAQMMTDPVMMTDDTVEDADTDADTDAALSLAEKKEALAQKVRNLLGDEDEEDDEGDEEGSGDTEGAEVALGSTGTNIWDVDATAAATLPVNGLFPVAPTAASSAASSSGCRSLLDRSSMVLTGHVAGVGSANQPPMTLSGPNAGASSRSNGASSSGSKWECSVTIVAYPLWVEASIDVHSCLSSSSSSLGSTLPTVQVSAVFSGPELKALGVDYEPLESSTKPGPGAKAKKSAGGEGVIGIAASQLVPLLSLVVEEDEDSGSLGVVDVVLRQPVVAADTAAAAAEATESAPAAAPTNVLVAEQVGQDGNGAVGEATAWGWSDEQGDVETGEASLVEDSEQVFKAIDENEQGGTDLLSDSMGGGEHREFEDVSKVSGAGEASGEVGEDTRAMLGQGIFSEDEEEDEADADFGQTYEREADAEAEQQEDEGGEEEEGEEGEEGEALPLVTPALQKQLRIFTGVCKRTAKDVVSYRKEEAQQQGAVDLIEQQVKALGALQGAEAQGAEAAVAELRARQKQQEQARQETLGMVGMCETKREEAADKLSAIVAEVEEGGFAYCPELEAARQIIQQQTEATEASESASQPVAAAPVAIVPQAPIAPEAPAAPSAPMAPIAPAAPAADDGEGEERKDGLVV
jgi:hypothetical protein